MKLYSRESCVWCKVVAKRLAELGLAYEYIDVEKDKRAEALMVIATRQQGVPVLENDGLWFVGRDRIFEYLAKMPSVDKSEKAI